MKLGNIQPSKRNRNRIKHEKNEAKKFKIIVELEKLKAIGDQEDLNVYVALKLVKKLQLL
jgi:hypothetical protein